MEFFFLCITIYKFIFYLTGDILDSKNSQDMEVQPRFLTVFYNFSLYNWKFKNLSGIYHIAGQVV